MSKTTIKMDTKVLDDLVRKECIAFNKWILSEGYLSSIRETKRDMYVNHKSGDINYYTVDQLYKLYKSKINP